MVVYVNGWDIVDDRRGDATPHFLGLSPGRARARGKDVEMRKQASSQKVANL